MLHLGNKLRSVLVGDGAILVAFLLAAVAGCDAEAPLAATDLAFPTDGAVADYPTSDEEASSCTGGEATVAVTGSYSVRSYVKCPYSASIIVELKYTGEIERDFWRSTSSGSIQTNTPVTLPGGNVSFVTSYTWLGTFLGTNCPSPTDTGTATIRTSHSLHIEMGENGGLIQRFVGLADDSQDTDRCGGPAAQIFMANTVAVGDSIPVASNCLPTANFWSDNAEVAYVANVFTNGVNNARIFGRAPGSATISAVCTGYGTYRSATANITVVQPSIDECELAPESLRAVDSNTEPFAHSSFEDCDGGAAPTPPAGGMGEDGIEVCYSVYRELWEWNDAAGAYEMTARWYLGSVCYLNGNMT